MRAPAFSDEEPTQPLAFVPVSVSMAELRAQQPEPKVLRHAGSRAITEVLPIEEAV